MYTVSLPQIEGDAIARGKKIQNPQSRQLSAWRVETEIVSRRLLESRETQPQVSA